jgi:hypothetical protein
MRIALFTTLLIAAAALTRAADAPPPKPPQLPPAARNALAYFASHQHPSGGWGQKVLDNAGPRRRGITSPDGSPLPRQTLTPPTIIDTCLVTLAFLEARRAAPDAPPDPAVRRAVDLIHDAVEAAGGAPDRNALALASPLVEKYCYTRPLDQALALEVLLPVRDRLPGGEPRRKLDFTLGMILTRIKSAQQTNGAWPGDGQLTYLSDALITRSLLIAARNGLDVDATTLDRARAASLRFYDPMTGESGDDSPHASCECALTLNLLYQIDQNARAAATAAKRLAARPGATPEQAAAAARRAAESQAARDALALAHKQFFKKLFDHNKPAPAKPRPGANPLDTAAAANPLDIAKAAEERKRIGIPVPVTAWDAIAYFLLLESLQESTDPDAPRVARGITTGLAEKQDRDGNWHDRSGSTRRYDAQDHFLTAWVTRALLVPLPPIP